MEQVVLSGEQIETICTQSVADLQRFHIENHVEMMRMGPVVKMLPVVVVLFVVAGTSDGVVLSQCGLKQQLEATGLTLPQGVQNQTTADFLAKIVCHVQLASGFDTRAIKHITYPKNCSTSQSSETGGHGTRSVRGTKGKQPSSNKGPASSEEQSSSEKHGDDDEDMRLWTLYGLFQLSDRVACDSAGGFTLNLCGLSCTKLIDDDITDDLACVQVIINNITTVSTDPNIADLINKMINLIYRKECASMVGSSYFANC